VFVFVCLSERDLYERNLREREGRGLPCPDAAVVVFSSVAVWHLKKDPNQPNLDFLNQFPTKKMVWQFLAIFRYYRKKYFSGLF
jgi:hypothetical protein